MDDEADGSVLQDYTAMFDYLKRSVWDMALGKPETVALHLITTEAIALGLRHMSCHTAALFTLFKKRIANGVDDSLSGMSAEKKYKEVCET